MKLYRRLLLIHQKNYIFYSAVSILPSTIIGSIAIMITLMNGYNTFQLIQVFITVVICSCLNASVLSVQKTKIILNFFILSLFVNIIIITFNIEKRIDFLSRIIY